MARAVEVLKKSLSDAYVVSTDHLASSESVNVISETEQKASELDTVWWKFAQFNEREVDYCYVLWKDTAFDTCTRFMVLLILYRTF